MTQEMTLITKEKLEYFFKENLEIYFKLLSGEFRNGYIKCFEENIIIFNERVLGEIPIHINEINSKTIKKSRGKNGKSC